MAAVDSFDTKKFFFSFPDRLWRGRGSAITPSVKTPPLLSAGGAITLPKNTEWPESQRGTNSELIVLI